MTEDQIPSHLGPNTRHNLKGSDWKLARLLWALNENGLGACCLICGAHYVAQDEADREDFTAAHKCSGLPTPPKVRKRSDLLMVDHLVDLLRRSRLGGEAAALAVGAVLERARHLDETERHQLADRLRSAAAGLEAEGNRWPLPPSYAAALAEAYQVEDVVTSASCIPGVTPGTEAPGPAGSPCCSKGYDVPEDWPELPGAHIDLEA